MENQKNQKILLSTNIQKNQDSKLHVVDQMNSITKEYQNIMEKFQQEIFQAKEINKEKNEKRSEKLKNIPTFTNLLQRTQVER
ncbi:unnamed protein product [Paramecium sonneborni]|uniref:Uncharacterized protein n=1 Tax=Paramecium sonneborni TaxID=65129 RepID=A0A8S1LDS1_9CILI|nr:unnamed protein product [Paramecium sonneborni]